MNKHMKYILILVAFSLLTVGGVWYVQNDSNHFFGMDSMMSREWGFSGSDLTKLPDHQVEKVRPTEIVELADGDVYEMEATVVSQEVGNRTVKRLAYNGQIPGPILKVQKGAKVTVNFTNNIDMETSLHSHGLRGDYLMDGAVPITPAIPVGDSFSYELEFPDTGVFWYHPHVREDYQQEMGLYGNFIVEEDGYWNEVNQEEYLIVDDFLEDGKFNSEVVSNTLMGRFGNVLLINDKTDYTLTVNQGEITRLFITNVANTRTFDLHLGGALVKQVGGDLGRIEKETEAKEIHIAPAERYIVEVLYPEAGTYPIVHRGQTIGTVVVKGGVSDRLKEFSTLRSNAGDYSDIRSKMSTYLAQKPDKKLRLDIEFKGAMGAMMGNTSETKNGLVNLMGVEMTREGAIEHCQGMPGMMGCEPYLNQGTSDRGSAMAGVGMMGEESEHSSDGIEWEDDMAMMNQMSTDENIEWIIEDQTTGKQNGDIDWSFNQGDMVKVRIYNDENGFHPMQHPIHFHGQRFVVLSVDGVPNEDMQWKDTVLIPMGRTVDILVDMSNSGQWMAHCHIAEHLHSGMMFNFEVK